MEPLFAPPERMAVIRRAWNNPTMDIGNTFVVRELLNGGVIRNQSIPCYVRFIQKANIDGPIDDYMVEVELYNESEDIAQFTEWMEHVINTVRARLRLWGIPYKETVDDAGNVFIHYKFGDQLKGGDAICTGTL